MNQTNTPTTNLGGMIALLATSALTDADVTRLSTAAGFTEEHTRELINHAKQLQQSITHGEPGFSLELSRSAGDSFELTGDRAIWIDIEDPKNAGRGFDIRINDSGDGPVVDVWMKNDADIPGADEDYVPLEPIATHGYAYSDHIHNYEDASDV